MLKHVVTPKFENKLTHEVFVQEAHMNHHELLATRHLLFAAQLLEEAAIFNRTFCSSVRPV